MNDRRRVPPVDPVCDREPVGEIDLLAYVDGVLDADPGRRDAVERHLQEHPEDAARVADFQAQNEALRGLGADWLAAPVPARLLDAVYSEATRSRAPAALKAAAVAAMVAVAAAGGWLAGAHRPGDDSLGEFAGRALADHDRYRGGPDAIAAGRAGVALQGAAPLNWLTRRISVRVQVPDLGPYGYSLVAQERVSLDGDEPAVRLGYRHKGGGLVNIYLRPRWENRPAAVMRKHGEGGTVLHWLDGPLAVAMTTGRDEAGTVDALVPAVRRAIADASVARPRAKGSISHDALLLDPTKPLPGAGGGPAVRGDTPAVQTN